MRPNPPSTTLHGRQGTGEATSAHRAGVVFGDAAQLRQGLQALAAGLAESANGQPGPNPPEAAEGGIRIHRAGRLVALYHGKAPVRYGAGLPRSSGVLQREAHRRARDSVAGRDSRQRHRSCGRWRVGFRARSGLRGGMRPDRPLEERGSKPRRNSGTRTREDSRGPGRRGHHTGGRAAAGGSRGRIRPP